MTDSRPPHDRGGWPGAGPVDRGEHDLADWELLTDALMRVLVQQRVLRVDEHRRAMESLSRDQYESPGYYGRWIAGLEALLIEKQILSRDEIERKVVELEARGD